MNKRGFGSYDVINHPSNNRDDQLKTTAMNQLHNYQSDAFIEQSNLNIVIDRSYNPNTNRLDLSGAVKGINLFTVLMSIKEAAFYHEIEHLFLNNNQFENAFNSDNPKLPELPPNLIILDLSNNHLSGSKFPWNQLPPKLEDLYLQNNKLDGKFDWRISHSLPKNLRLLWIQGNRFKGGLSLQSFPGSLRSLTMSKALADGSNDFERAKIYRGDIKGDGNQVLVDVRSLTHYGATDRHHYDNPGD